jgi:hypothetical protein
MAENMQNIFHEENIVYSKVLKTGVKIAFFLLILSFAIYLTGIVPSLIPLNSMPVYWKMSADELCKALHTPRGWGWVCHIYKGDCLNFVGITILGTLTILCYMSILPALIRKKDVSYVILTILQIFVLLLAVTGVISGKPH